MLFSFALKNFSVGWLQGLRMLSEARDLVCYRGRKGLLSEMWLASQMPTTTILDVKEKPHPCSRDVGVAASCTSWTRLL